MKNPQKFCTSLIPTSE